MLASYAVVMRRSALITAPAALVMIVLSTIISGTQGLVGAVLGAALVAAFFGISALVISWAGRRSPQTAMVAAMVAYLVKILALLVLVAEFAGTTAFNGKLFGFTAIVCIVVWSAAQAITSMRLKVPYVEPDRKR
jgi:ATP synthase protein I